MLVWLHDLVAGIHESKGEHFFIEFEKSQQRGQCLTIFTFCVFACVCFLKKHDNIYLGNLITGAADLPGDVISFLVIERIGRKKTLLISMTSAAILPLFFAAAPKGSPVWAMLGSASFGFVSVGGWNALSILSPELFHTSIRSTMHGILTALGRIGGFLGTYFVGHMMSNAGIWLPCIFATSILSLGCVAALFVPETSGKVITDYQVQENKQQQQHSRKQAIP